MNTFWRRVSLGGKFHEFVVKEWVHSISMPAPALYRSRCGIDVNWNWGRGKGLLGIVSRDRIADDECCRSCNRAAGRES